MVGPPGSGKSMLAARLSGILPPLEPSEALELGMIQSIAGGLRGGGLLRERPFRDPHHSASLPALVGGGLRVRPGEISVAHQGVLFLKSTPITQLRSRRSHRKGFACPVRGNLIIPAPAHRRSE